MQDLSKARLACSAIAILFLLPTGFSSVSAAIPCVDRPIVQATEETHDDAEIIELPISMEDLFTGDTAADRTGAKPVLDRNTRLLVIDAVDNQVRCLNQYDSSIFAVNSTADFRVRVFGTLDIMERESYFTGSANIVSVSLPLELADGRFLVDTQMVTNTDIFLDGELVFQRIGEYYLPS